MAEKLTKAAVSQFLESAKNSLNYLSQLKMEIGENPRVRNAIDEKELLQLYSRTRRVREYLRRWMSAYPTPDGVHLPPEDLNLLCSCMLYEFSRLEKIVSENSMTASGDQEWIDKRKAVLSTWLLELANRPVEQLPSPFGRNDVSYDVRLLIGAVRRKLSGDEPPLDPATGIFMPTNVEDSGSGSGSGIFKAPSRIEAPPPRSAPADSVAATIAEGPAVVGGESSDVVEIAHVRDYRLRLAMALDVRSYERAVDLDDHRMATLLLDSILNGLLIDHGLSHSSALGLTDTPLSWSVEGICAAVLGPAFGERERALFQLLERSHALLRPALQLADPIVVNKATVHEAEAFVKQVAFVLSSAGHGGGAHEAVTIL